MPSVFWLVWVEQNQNYGLLSPRWYPGGSETRWMMMVYDPEWLSIRDQMWLDAFFTLSLDSLCKVTLMAPKDNQRVGAILQPLKPVYRWEEKDLVLPISTMIGWLVAKFARSVFFGGACRCLFHVSLMFVSTCFSDLKCLSQMGTGRGWWAAWFVTLATDHCALECCGLRWCPSKPT